MSKQIKILTLGSGELAKEFIIAAQRYGFKTIAVDKYSYAPAMHVADYSEVIDMLDPKELDRVVYKHRPHYIVPEIEAICISKLFDYESKGMIVVPCAKAVEITMNRKKTRDLAVSLGLKTARYKYAYNATELYDAVYEIGFPCVVKPFMSSSGKGQSVVKIADEIASAWETAVNGARGKLDSGDFGVIVEEFINFSSEITLLTVTSSSDTSDGVKVSFCQPIGHIQKNGDYQESWQPHLDISLEQYRKAKEYAKTIVKELGGYGVWGVEFFLLNEIDQNPDELVVVAGENNGTILLFSELSPRPHDTGLVTLATQWQNEFELHLRAMLGFRINTRLRSSGASKAICCSEDLDGVYDPVYTGLSDALRVSIDSPFSKVNLSFDKLFLKVNLSVLLFGKPLGYPGRRMGVILSSIHNSWVEKRPHVVVLSDYDNFDEKLEDEVKLCREYASVAEKNIKINKNNFNDSIDSDNENKTSLDANLQPNETLWTTVTKIWDHM